MKAVVFVKILLIISLYCCQAFAIKPERIYHTRPLDFKMNYKEFKIKTPDNFNINIWEIESEIQIRTGKTIIICAGDAGNMGYYLRRANVPHQNGFLRLYYLIIAVLVKVMILKLILPYCFTMNFCWIMKLC